MSKSLVVLLGILALTAANVPGFDALAPGSGRSISRARASESAPLPFYYDLYTFRGDPGNTAVVAAFSVPVGRLKREREAGEVLYRFDVTLVLSDTALHSVWRSDDSVFVSVPSPLSSRHLLFTNVELQAPPSVTTLQRVIMTDASTPGIGQLYSSPFPIPDYSGTHLMLSDITMGQPDAQVGWSRGDVTLALWPTSQFPGSSFDLYYEIYNLAADHGYATEISIEHLDDSGDPREGDGNTVQTRFSGESAPGPDGSQPEHRYVEASLDDGHYRITVRVTDEDTGETASRSRLFEVSGQGRGSTLVPALPANRIGEPAGG